MCGYCYCWHAVLLQPVRFVLRQGGIRGHAERLPSPAAAQVDDIDSATRPASSHFDRQQVDSPLAWLVSGTITSKWRMKDDSRCKKIWRRWRSRTACGGTKAARCHRVLQTARHGCLTNARQRVLLQGALSQTDHDLPLGRLSWRSKKRPPRSIFKRLSELGRYTFSTLCSSRQHTQPLHCCSLPYAIPALRSVLSSGGAWLEEWLPLIGAWLAGPGDNPGANRGSRRFIRESGIREQVSLERSPLSTLHASCPLLGATEQPSSSGGLF